MTIPWEAVTALGTWALAGGAVLMVWRQLVLTKRTLSADVFSRLGDRWDSIEMRKKRQRLSAALRERRVETIRSQLIEDVINFFEDVGTMLRHGYLERGPTWHAFSVATRHYWAACGEKYVTDMRDEYADNTFYTEFEFLAQQMEAEDCHRRRKKPSELRISSKAIADFLEDETNLLID